MHKLILDKKAADFLRKSDKSLRERLIQKINVLSTNPRSGIPLTGNLTGLWKLRIGDYRVIYQIRDSELVVLVIRIGHRKNIYD